MINRRNLLIFILSLLFSNNSKSNNECRKTPAQPKGPFFKKNITGNKNDLSNNGKASGELIKIEGRILDHNCTPYSFSNLDIWQANTYGKYNHANDFSSNKIDKNFYGYKRISSDQHGYYFFTTIFPGSYKISDNIVRAPHIHLKVNTKNNKSLTTQIYFKGHPHNKNDFLLNSTSFKSLLEVSLIKSDKKIATGIFNIII
ncbi:protocatechuate 3,4-dioxygenase [Alphaproteobacteria bacterium]|nr:protocatechuate 3,4-dioxygenase [Alphaproteobacteria bacterium]